MAIEHLFLFSIVEGVMTVALLKYFLKNEPTLIHAMKEASREKV
jgi:ABC-type Co2+ transport system permease subunit